VYLSLRKMKGRKLCAWSEEGGGQKPHGLPPVHLRGWWWLAEACGERLTGCIAFVCIRK